MLSGFLVQVRTREASSYLAVLAVFARDSCAAPGNPELQGKNHAGEERRHTLVPLPKKRQSMRLRDCRIHGGPDHYQQHRGVMTHDGKVASKEQSSYYPNLHQRAQMNIASAKHDAGQAYGN